MRPTTACDSPSSPPAGCSLVPLAAPMRRGEGSHNARPSALFLAQLIATALKAPQTRTRRRAEPDAAAARYAAAVDCGVVLPGICVLR
jgi:hypothetical protein